MEFDEFKSQYGLRKCCKCINCKFSEHSFVESLSCEVLTCSKMKQLNVKDPIIGEDDCCILFDEMSK